MWSRVQTVQRNWNTLFRSFGRAASKTSSLQSRLSAVRKDIPRDDPVEEESGSSRLDSSHKRVGSDSKPLEMGDSTKERLGHHAKSQKGTLDNTNPQNDQDEEANMEDERNTKGPSQASIQLAQRQKVKLLA